MAYNDPSAVVRGLNDFPRDEWPPVLITHMSFQLMVGFGMFMFAVALWWAYVAWFRRRERLPRPLLWALVVCAPLGFLAIELGWIVTEVGRQPWIIQGIMRTAEAVTPMPGLLAPLLTVIAVYLGLTVVVTYLMVRQIRATRQFEPEAHAVGGSGG
jgi:cytochrome d ubiquinol oxidase subunit I